MASELGDAAKGEGGRAAKFRTAAALPRLGGHLALDFINTVDWRDRPAPIEYLVSYPALIAWAREAGVIAPEEAAELADHAAAEGAEAKSLLDAALELREASHGLLRAAALGRSASADDLAGLNRVLRRFPQRGEIIGAGDGYAWQSSASGDPLAYPVERLAAAAAELLLAPAQLRRVRLCAGLGCGWLFLDLSPSRRRRWCSMESCGNRAKARRHHAKYGGEGPSR